MWELKDPKVILEEKNPSEELGYKFYVLSWDDGDNKLSTVEEFLQDHSEELIDVVERQDNENIYKVFATNLEIIFMIIVT